MTLTSPTTDTGTSAERPLLAFLDTEFCDFERPELISIALAAEQGPDFYVELTDGWSPGHCSGFVQRQVLPLLQGGAVAMTRAQAAEALRRWFQGCKRPVQVVSDAPDYDWPQLVGLLQGTLPPNLLPRCAAFYCSSFPAEYANELELTRQRYHLTQRNCTAMAGEHHALHDARALREQWLQAELLSPAIISRIMAG